ncbi:MAG: hypothetical protein JSU96_05205, partial [Acidobacteriota bacterium]
LFLGFAAIMVLGGGLCLAGKPGGGTQPKDFARLSTEMDSTKRLRQNGEAYIDGQEGVRSVIAENAGYQFMSAYRPYDPPRTAYVDLSDQVEEGPQSFDPPTEPVPLHLAIMWDIWAIPDGQTATGPMGGSIDVNGKMYYFRFNSNSKVGASNVEVERISRTSWTVRSTGYETVRIVGIGKGKNADEDFGLYYLPFELTLTDLSTSAQKAVTPEDIFTWSPQGDRIARVVSDPGGDHTIEVIDLQTGSVLNEYGRGVFGSAPRGLTWANRTEMLAFSAYSHDGVETLYILNVRSGGLMEIGLGSAPRWAPDDSRLVYLSEDGISIFDMSRGAVVTVPRNGLD